MKKFIVLSLFILLIIYSCAKKDEPAAPQPSPTPIQTVTAQDGFEPDDGQAGATVLTYTPAAGEASAGHNHHYSCDADWFTFTTYNTNVYWVYTSNLGADSDTYIYLYLYDSGSLTLVDEDDNGGGGSASSLTFSADGGVVYYVKAVHANCKDGTQTTPLSGPATGYDFTATYD